MSGVLAVLVHHGDVGPTVDAAHRLLPFAPGVTVIANDAVARPDDLDERVVWVCSVTNHGYAGGVLHAVQASARSDVVVVLNTDVHLPEDAWHRCLRDLDDDPGLGVVAPVLRRPDGTLQSGAGRVRGLLHWYVADRDPGDRVETCTWVTGAAMFVRRSLLDRVAWDTSYFLGFEDVDLCRRARALGLRVGCDGRVSAVHDDGAVIGSLWNYYFIRNRLWWSRRHEAWWRFVLAVVNALWLAGRSVLGDVRHRRSRELSTLFVHGVLDGLRPRSAVREPRAEVLRNRVRPPASPGRAS